MLNCELPLATRWHAIQAFNRGLFDIFIATDDPKLMQGRAKNEPTEAPGMSKGARRKRGKRAQGPSAEDAEFGVSRGVDFCDVPDAAPTLTRTRTLTRTPTRTLTPGP